MTSNSDNLMPDDDRSLDELIRSAGEGDAEGFVRPPDDVIEVYLLGRANKQQRAIIHTAILKSSEFRRELALMVKDLDDLDSHQLRQGREQASHRVEDETRSVPSAKTDQAVVSKIFSRLGSSRILVAAACLFLAAISIIYFTDRGRTYSTVDMVLESNRVDPNLLVAINLRGDSPANMPVSYSSAVDAALAAFRNAIEFIDGQPRALPLESSDPLVSEYFVLRIDKSETSHSDFQLPLSESEQALMIETLQFWFLTLPDLSLYSLTPRNSDQHLRAVARWSGEFLVVATWQVDSGYSSARAIEQ